MADKHYIMSLGVPKPKTAAEAVRGAKKFLASVYGLRQEQLMVRKKTVPQNAMLVYTTTVSPDDVEDRS